jgi:hypothetical protein
MARRDSAEKSSVHPSRPFMLSLVEAFLDFFSRIKKVCLTLSLLSV